MTLSTDSKFSQAVSKIDTLRTALLEKSPNLPNILRDVHQLLKKDEEVVVLLNEEQISVVVSGLQQQTLTNLQEDIKKKTPSKAKAIASSKSILSDLGF